MEKTERQKDRKHKKKPAFPEAGDIIIEFIEILACLKIKATPESRIKRGILFSRCFQADKNRS